MHRRKTNVSKLKAALKRKDAELEKRKVLNRHFSDMQLHILKAKGIDDNALKSYRPLGPIKAQTDNTSVNLYGIITNDTEADFLNEIGIEAIGPRAFREQLNAIEGDTVTLRINSIGGDVPDASVMLNTVMEFQEKGGTVNAIVEGISASAATFIMAAADNVSASPMASVLIHRAWGTLSGDAGDFRNYAQSLDGTDAQLIAIYTTVTGKDEDEIVALMEQDRAISAQEAQEFGLIDNVLAIRGQEEDDEDDKDDEDDNDGDDGDDGDVDTDDDDADEPDDTDDGDDSDGDDGEDEPDGVEEEDDPSGDDDEDDEDEDEQAKKRKAKKAVKTRAGSKGARNAPAVSELFRYLNS